MFVNYFYEIFENTKNAFALKSDSELERAYFLFRMIANEPLVRIGTAVTNFAIKAHLPVEGLIRSTVFDHFCGGVNEEDCLPVVEKMYSKGVCSVLDYSVEAKEDETQFDAALDITLKILEFVKEKNSIPFAVFKPTGFGRFALYEKLGSGTPFTPDEQAEWERVVARFEKVCEKTDCQIANINSESQIVISGSDNSIFLATQILKELGSKVIPLKVSGAFHSKLMSEAKPALFNAINNSTFNKPVCPIVSNYDGIARNDKDEIKNALIQQIDNPVLWLKSVNTLKEISSSFIEIGPKKVLGNIIKKIDDSLIITNYNCYSDL